MSRRYLIGLAAILMASQILIAQEASNPSPCIQVEPIKDPCKYAPSFNAPAVVDVTTESSWGSSLFTDVSFLYWHGSQEGLQLAVNGVFSPILIPPANDALSYLSPSTTPLIQSFDYHPGFKVGLGFVTDHQWQVRADYTWLRGSTSLNENVPTALDQISGVDLTKYPSTGQPVWEIDAWFLQGSDGGQTLSGTNITSTWHYAIDFLDAVVSRPFYQGPSLAIDPFGGLRATWIRQSLQVGLMEVSGMFSEPNTTQPIFSYNHSQSWGIGPKIGFDSSWLLPMGFRLEACVAADLIYTQYTKISHSEDAASTGFNPGPYLTIIRDYDCLRTMAELGLGFGWGQYFACNKYHLDFSAAYDFTYMWRQNMMRVIVDEVRAGIGSAASDFFLHGLTLNGRFDF